METTLNISDEKCPHKKKPCKVMNFYKHSKNHLLKVYKLQPISIPQYIGGTHIKCQKISCWYDHPFNTIADP